MRRSMQAAARMSAASGSVAKRFAARGSAASKALALLALVGCGMAGTLAVFAQDRAGMPAWVDSAVMAAQSIEGSDWVYDGRTYSAQRFSPLTGINAGNVAELGIAWYDELNTYRGVEATPLYADGVLYNTLPFNITTAYNAATGEKLWTYDPEVPREYARYTCCEPVSRGLAMWKGKIIIATLDGRLIALDAKTGEPIWTAQTFEHDMPYAITGAPRVFDGRVVVGNAGGDFGVRGFVSAWDAETGKKLWKFFLAPGNPADGPDGEASDSVLDMMAATWSGEWWTLGGGANAWDSIAYDPEHELVYVGTGNGSPLSWEYRSNSEGDNLFICSIVALHADTGEYAWHYQMVPGEDWDYTCTASIVQADLEIDGELRQVVMQAPKTGFFYVLDRVTGEFISAEEIAPVNWATVDPVSGKVTVNPQVRYGVDPVLVMPGPGGAHNWFPMAYSPRTGLAYLPTYESARVYALDPNYVAKPFRSNSGWGGYTGEALAKRNVLQAEGDKIERAYLTAWDPVAQEARWKVPLPRHGNGGAMVTASDLVFEGTTKQTFAAFDAGTGEVLWEVPTQSAPVAGPITYLLDGVQYVAVNAGWGGGAAQVERGAGIELPRAPARLLVFRLGGDVSLPPLEATEPVQEPPPVRASEEEIARGAVLFADTCSVCHGQQAIGGLKDLRFMTRETHDQFNRIVLEGIYVDKGMASFADLLTVEEVEAIHGYLIARANEDWSRPESDGTGPH